jgi:DNA-binding MarR family transcriptional regulator
MTTAHRLQRLRDTLTAAANYFDAHGYAPTIRDIADAIELSTSAIHGYLFDLEVRGYVTHKRRSARSLQITDAGRQWLANITAPNHPGPRSETQGG